MSLEGSQAMEEKRLRLLLLDDERSFREPLKAYLERHFGYQVEAVGDAATALDRVKEAQGRYDVALIDQVLADDPEDVGGLEFMREIKARYPAIECILFTAWGIEPREQALREGAFSYLAKPFDRNELAILINAAAERRRLRLIGEAILSERELGRVLEQINSAACSLTGADEASITLPDPETGKLRVYQSTYSGEPQFTRLFRGTRLSREIIERGQVVRIPDTAADPRVHPRVHKAGIWALVGVPIPCGGRNIGALYVFSRQAGGLGEWRPVTILQTLASQAGVAIANAQAFEQARTLQEYARALHEASKAVASAHDPEQLWQSVANQARAATGARRTVVVLADRDLLDAAAQSGDEPEDLTIRPAGISREVFESKEPRFFADARDPAHGLNPAMLKDWLRSAACLPLRDEKGRTIGVLWLEFDKPQSFSPAEQRSLSLYADHAALAYGTVRRLRQLRLHGQIAAKLTAMADPRDVLQGIVDGACDVLEADAAVLLPYDAASGAFAGYVVASGISEEVLERHRRERPGPGGAFEIVIREGYLEIADVDDPQLQARYPFLKDKSGLRGDIGVKAFQGIALRMGEQKGAEALGVLYVDYMEPRRFDAEDRSSLESFARQASLALHNAKSRAHLERTQRAAGLISQAATQENLKSTLDTLVASIKENFNADAVTIYSYDEGADRFGEWASLVDGRRDSPTSRPAEKLGQAQEGYAVWEILHLDESKPYLCVEDDRDRTHPLLKGIFATTEGIKAALGMQLRAGGRKVGVLFVDYRAPHRFSPMEIASVGLFANQAAVAIRNAQLLAEAQRRYEELRQVKGLIGNVTALEWMRMVAGHWSHDIGKKVATCQNHIYLLRKELGPSAKKIEPRLGQLEEALQEISKVAIVAPLSGAEGVAPLPLNSTVRKHLEGLWNFRRPRDVQLVLDLEEGLDDRVTVRASSAWLGRALDILADNAVEAMLRADSPQKVLTVRTRLLEERTVEIALEDTGPGIPEEILHRLRAGQPIEKQPGEKGAGVGVMVARLIAQTYGGELKIETKLGYGTTVAIALPTERARN